MSEAQKEVNFLKLQKYVFKYTSAWWGSSFVAALSAISQTADKKSRKSMTVDQPEAQGIMDKMTNLTLQAKDAVMGGGGSAVEDD